MRYWMDTEFSEDGTIIDLISIGIVAEDGREYYSQSVDVDGDKVNPWVLKNVIPHLTQCPNQEAGFLTHALMGKCSHHECPWRTREQIKQDILTFMDPEKYGEPEIWTYYGAYDHVAFCQIFGTMMDLPEGYLMYTMYIKQWCKMLGDPQLPEQGKGEHNALEDARWNKQAWEFLKALDTYQLMGT